MARSAHVATTTRKQVRAVPYAHPAKPNRSLGQGLSRHKPYHVESLPKPTLGLGHATLVFPNVYMHSAQDPTFDTGTNTATTGLNTPELVRYIPGQPTEYPGLIASLSWNSFHHPDISTGVIPEECLSPTWANSGVELPGSDHDHACAGWPFNQSQHHGQFFQQPLQSSGSFTREGTDSFADAHSEVVAAYVCQQSGALYPGPLGIPYYPIITADSTQVLPYNITLLQPSEARGAMDESWVFEPVETSFIASYGDRDLAETLADNVPAYLAPSSDSEDGVLVERPRASDESSDGRPTSPSGLVTQPLAVAKRHSRSRLSPERRLQAASTRKWRACIRCYIQKIRCIPNPENPRGSCCLTCTNVSRESKKVIHRLPCLRLRLTEVVMFRGGGLNLTSRWTGTAVKDLSPNDWVDSELRTLTWQLEHSPRPLQFAVKRFRPLQGDCVTRKWRDSNGQPRETWIEPFGLADIQKTASDYMAYNFTFSLASLNMVKETMIGQVEDVVCRTYDEVSKLIVMTERPPGLRGKNVHPADFLHQYVKLWFGIRNSVGSAYITPGTDTLDMVSERHPDYPYGSRISIPRMISEQFYNLQYEKLLVPTRKRVLEDLNRMMTGKQPDHFFTVYLTVFMLLYETSFASADRHRRAMQYGEATYYSLPLFVEQLQFGANIVLLHWHYYKRGFNPLRTDWDNVKDKAIWSTLSVAQRQFLCDSWQYFEDRAARPMEKLTWKDDLYFVAQMFEDDLCFGATYSGS